jgi:5'-nucleotidase
MRPFLLITNDDGIHAPGIKHLWQAVHDFADVAIVAPMVEKSGCGLSITWKKPLHIQPVAWENNTAAWALTGTPADCVKIALAGLLPRKPDMVISGINKGSNAGRTVLYSGTIGGVTEGTLKEIPGIAFSFCDQTQPPLDITKPYIAPLIQYFLKNPLTKGTLLNVNFPPDCEKGVKGLRMAKQGRSYWRESPDQRTHPEGATYYWLGGAWGPVEEDPESDVALLNQGYITASPIQVSELTCQQTLGKYREVTEKTLIESFLPPQSARSQ